MARASQEAQRASVPAVSHPCLVCPFCVACPPPPFGVSRDRPVKCWRGEGETPRQAAASEEEGQWGDWRKL